MKRSIHLVVYAGLLILYSLQANSQVWNGDLTFRSQSEIDDFANQSYTSVNGKLVIDDAADGGHDIRNLAGLAGLTSVSGFLQIINNNLLVNTVYLNLVSVAGVQIGNNAALTEVNGLLLTSTSTGISIANNTSLTSITAFSTLTFIEGGLEIQTNPLLTNLDGFANVSTVTGILKVDNNNNLANLDAFSHLTQSNTLIVRNNPSLTNINGLSGLTSVGQLTITNNPLLINVDGLANLTTITSYLEIANNESLQNITGLSNLNSQAGFEMHIKNNNALQSINGAPGIIYLTTLRILSNPALTGIAGFSNVQNIGAIEIAENRALVTLSGFDNLDEVWGNLILQQNNELTTINAFTQLSNVRGNFISINNYIVESIATLPLLDSVGGLLSVVLDTMLANLDFVPNLLYVAGSLRIAACYRLENINGLSKLHTVNGDISFFSCPKITSLQPLSSITSVGRQLIVESMAGLKSLAGLRFITKVGTHLHISSNPQLTNLNDLSGIDTVGGDLVITSNPLLTNLDGLSNLRSAYLVYINNNVVLADFCGLYGLYAAGGPTFATTISQNQVNPTQEDIRNAGPCSTLPVHFLVFNLKCTDNKIQLTWITANEINNSHFIIQRSSNGNTWNDLDLVPAAGNNGGVTQYAFTDDQPLANAYYRLAQVDLDRKIHYSSVIRAACAANTRYAVWPNPASDKVLVNIRVNNTTAGILKLADSKGIILKSKKIILLPGQNQIEINISDIPKGIYFLQVIYNGTMDQQRTVLLKN